MDSKAIIRILPNQNQSFYISGKGFRLPAFLREEIPKKTNVFFFSAQTDDRNGNQANGRKTRAPRGF